jgi:hypothetical protein
MAPEQPLRQLGFVLRSNRLLDPATGTVLEEWGPAG